MLIILAVAGRPSLAAEADPSHNEGVVGSAAFDEEPGSAAGSNWPSREQLMRVITLRDYNTRVVLMGTVLLGLTAGVVGVFMLLRRRSLVGDVVGHASLPGIAVAFIVLEAVRPGSGKSLTGLLVGAAVAGLVAVLLTVAIRKTTRIKEDAALAIVLSVFFGLGVALLTIVQDLPSGNAAGLHHYIYGKAALMLAEDVELIAKASALVLVVSVLLFKEFSLVCFDGEFAAAQGWPVVLLDLVLMGLVVVVTVMGLESVGLLLVVALLIIPAAAARFWTDHLRRMAAVAAVLGGLSALVGVVTSALFPRLAAGAVIVLVGAVGFAVSMLFGTQRGVLLRVLARARSRRRIGRHDLLRAFYECLESAAVPAEPGTEPSPGHAAIPVEFLLGKRSWSPGRLKRLLATASREGLVRQASSGGYQLTSEGERQARRVARNHRLWELYLVTHADIAPSHVDRDADAIEHVLEPRVVEALEALLESYIATSAHGARMFGSPSGLRVRPESVQEQPQTAVPPSPHEIGPSRGTEN
jgi:manganese/zinc/iron transport system permease protein